MITKLLSKEWLFWAVIVSTFAFFISILFLVVYPYDPITVDSFIVDKYEVIPGDKVTFHFKGKKNYNVSPTISIDLVDGEHFHVMDYPGTNPKGIIDNKRSFIVPNIPAKKYRLRWSATYQINAFANPRRTVETDWITVNPSEYHRGK